MRDQQPTQPPVPSWRRLKIIAVFVVAFALQGMSLAIFRVDDVKPPILVTNTEDDPDDPPVGSLRHAIRLANATAGLDVILFNIAIVNGTNISIPLQASLDPIIHPLILSGGTITQTNRITIDGRNFLGDMVIISQAHGTTIQGLRFANVQQGSAIVITSTNNTLIQGNVIEQSRQGIRLVNGGQITFTSNTINDVDEFGISAESTRDLLLQNVVISNVHSGSALQLLDGVRNARVITNTFTNVEGAAIEAGGDPSPLEVFLGWITTNNAREQITFEPGVNNDFPAPTILSARVISPSLRLRVQSTADPAIYTYPLSVAFYAVQEGDYSPLGFSALLDETAFLAARAISIPLGRRLINFDQVSAIATTANPSSSVFADPVTLQLGLDVEIDVKPGNDVSCINLESKGVIAVVVFGSEELDVTDIDQESLLLADSQARTRGNSGKIGSLEDVNEDGFLDLIVHFPTEDLELSPAVEEVTLTGMLSDGTPITGSDAICIAPPSAAKNSGIESEIVQTELFQNYPNPFNPQTTIDFQIPEARHVVVRIFNLLGQEVRKLVDADFEAGAYSVQWDGRANNGLPLSTGLYLYKLQAGDFEQERTMHLLR